MVAFDYPVGKFDTQGRITATERSNDSDGYNTEAQDFGLADYEKYKKLGWYHLGDDWNGDSGSDTDSGDPVYSVADGTARFAGVGGTGWGNVVIIEHPMSDGEYGGAVASMYAHLDSIDPKVVAAAAAAAKGEGNSDVGRGDVIGAIGDSGLDRSDPNVRAHLHFEIRSDESIGDGEGYAPDERGRLDPSDFIAAHRGPGSGKDTVNGSGSGGGNSDDIKGTTSTGGRLIGGPGNDILDGDASNNDIQGNSGNDELSGGGGNDKLNGGPDDDPINVDVMTGGPGKDQFWASTGSDVITDFNPDEDSLWLPEDTEGRFNAWANTTMLTYLNGTVALEGVDLGPHVAAKEYPWLEWHEDMPLIA